MTNKRPKALEEVWEWEEKIYQKTKDMDLKQYVKYIREKNKEILSSGNQLGQLDRKEQFIQK